MPISADIPNHSYAEAGVVRAINVQRRRRGLRTLRPRRGLARVSAQHTFQMLANDSLQHASFDGTSIVARWVCTRTLGPVVVMSRRVTSFQFATDSPPTARIVSPIAIEEASAGADAVART